MVKVQRTGFDTVEISPDRENDGKYLVVRRNDEGNWEVMQKYRQVASAGTLLSSHGSADEAVSWAKNHIEGVHDELSDALKKHGL